MKENSYICNIYIESLKMFQKGFLIRSLKKNVLTSLEVIYRAKMNPSIVFIISMFTTNGTISSQEVVETKSDKFVMTNSFRVYESLRHLISPFPKSQ